MNKLLEMDPNGVVEWKDMTTINPVTDYMGYKQLKELIRESGQLVPIALVRDNDDRLVMIDGRHRTRVCKELRRNIKYKVYDVDINDREALLNVVLGLDASRSTTLTQKAVKAWKLKNRNSILTIDSVAIKCGVRRELVSLVQTINKYSSSDVMNGGKEAVIDILFNGGKVKILGNNDEPKETSSLEAIAKFYKRLYEGVITVDDRYELKWNPESQIKTEAGKKWYYDATARWEIGQLPAMIKNDIIKHMVELANYKCNVQ